MKPDDFEFLSQTLKTRSGLMLSSDKIYLLESRLTPLARKQGMETLDQLVQTLRTRRDETLLRAVTEAMTTNESFFFRDTTPFEHFEKVVLPGLRIRRDAEKKIRIWSAAASTGQEPYSLGMILKEQGPKLAGWTFDILGTDLSNDVLARAKAGRYSQFEVQRGLPIKLLIKYFTQQGDYWILKDEIRNMVSYRAFNLLDNFAGLGRFDVVYCRNVLIYFDQPTKTKVLEKLHALMPPDGYLFLGAAETVLGITDRFRPVPGYRGMYVPAEADPALMAAVG
ncbi:MAG: CheR family methyltransferase [Rhodothalassiaceae bacterium]